VALETLARLAGRMSAMSLATEATRRGVYLQELWTHRDLILRFAARDIKARYKQTVFGIAWAVLQPVALMLIFTMVFSRFAKVPSDGIPYPVFSYAGLIFWNFFAMTVSQGTLAISANAALVRKIYFPRETLLLSIVLSAGLDLLVAALLLGSLMVYYQVTVGLAILWVPVLLSLQTLFALGIVCITSSLHVNFRDVGHAIPLMLQLGLLATPVAYPLSVVPPGVLPVYLLNPMATIIAAYRSVILTSTRPDLSGLGLAALSACLLLTVGYAIFKVAERTFADVI
jgi:lipopolysaccharide transport system permease protein